MRHINLKVNLLDIYKSELFSILIVYIKWNVGKFQTFSSDMIFSKNIIFSKYEIKIVMLK